MAFAPRAGWIGVVACLVSLCALPLPAQGLNSSRQSIAEDRSISLMSELEESFSNPVLIRTLRIGAESSIALVGGGREWPQVRQLYSGPIWILHFDATRALVDAAMGSITTSPYNIYYGSEFTALSTSVAPTSIEVQIVVTERGRTELQAFKTGVRFVADFLIHDGYLYVSTEKTSANIRRFDLETGEEFQYEGLFAHNPALVLLDNRLFAVHEGQAFELVGDRFQEAEMVGIPTEPASDHYSVHKEATEYQYFESWKELIEAAPFR